MKRGGQMEKRKLRFVDGGGGDGCGGGCIYNSYI